MKLLATGASGFIGTHLVEAAIARGHQVLNVDTKPPLIVTDRPYWRELDIMDADGLRAAVRDFEPDHVIHLAARTDCVEDVSVEEGYQANTRGTANVLDAVRACPSVQRLLVTSTQYVFNKGSTLPAHDEDFHPITVYGESKVISEQLTRDADLPCSWAIVRPTNVWGPWHQRQRDNFFYALETGIYIHPGHEPVKRSYGYVGNVVHQMLALLDAPREQIHRRVFYLGDRPIELLEWVNAFAVRMKGRPVRVAPSSLIKVLGRVGDGISRVTGKPFLITTTRYQSMTQPYLVPMDPTFEVTGEPPYSLERGVEATASWLQNQR